ncbi:Protein MAINTENANCE OF MERISTEMS [Glycine soja]
MLLYLNDLNPCGEYALGVVALAYLYNQLSYANFYDNKLIGGYMTLLMAWVFEHLQTIPYCEKPKTSDHKKSLAARWKPLRGSGTTNLTRFK